MFLCEREFQITLKTKVCSDDSLLYEARIKNPFGTLTIIRSERLEDIFLTIKKKLFEV